MIERPRKAENCSTRTGETAYSRLPSVIDTRCRERWRSQRRQRRMREIEADNRDRELEAQRRATLQIESDAFLARQADDFAKMSDARKREIARTLPTNAETKLSFGAAAAKPAGPKQGQATTTTKIALGAAEDEEEEGKKRRQLIPLTYSDDEDAEDVKRKRRSAHRMTPAEKQRKARDLRDSLPRDKEALFEMRVRWSLVSDVRFAVCSQTRPDTDLPSFRIYWKAR